LSNAEKRAAGAMAAAEGVAVSDLCGDLSIPRSTYYGSREARRAAEDRRARIEWAAVRVREAFEASGGVYGSAAVAAALRRRAPGGPEPVGLLGLDPGDRDTPLILSEKVVRRLMRQQGLVAARARKGRGRYSSYAGELRERPCNQLLLEGGGHCFAAGLPFSVIVTDFTEFALPGGEKCYLSPAIDCFDGDVVAWRISRHPDAALACGMLEDAAAKAGGRSFVVHTDGGGVYMSDAWVKACERLKVERSMSRKATSPDNARAEGFFGALKAEFFHCRDWTGVTCERFAAELDAYIRWYRDCRIKESLGWRTIREYREELGVAA
jgi:transposase InsO family protein